MKRSSLLWLVATVAFWGVAFGYDARQAQALFVYSSVVGMLALVDQLIFHVIRARLGY